MKKNGKGKNILLIILCIILFAVLGSLVVWNKKQTNKEMQKLEQMADAARESDKKALKESDKKEKKVEKELQQKAAEEKEETKNEPASVPTVEPERKTEGVVCWGDDLLTESDTAQYSYMTVLQKILQENGYNLPVLNKTIQGGGTLSMMKKAGVSEEVIQGYISAHLQAANGGEIYITEQGVRDFTEEELVRDDLNYIPVIFMGYYGGWNHDPNELAQQQEYILKTFPNQDRFIVVGTAPLDGTVTSDALDAALSQKWGEHYISLASVTTYPASRYEAQEAMAQAIYQKMIDLNYMNAEKQEVQNNGTEKAQ